MDIENIQRYQRKFQQHILEIIINTALQRLSVLYKLWAEAGAIPHYRNLLQSRSSCLVLAMISQKILDELDCEQILLTKDCSYEEHAHVLILKLFSFLM